MVGVGRGVAIFAWVFACAFASVSPALSSMIISNPAPPTAAEVTKLDLLRGFSKNYMPPKMTEMCKLDGGKKVFARKKNVAGYARVQSVQDWEVPPVTLMASGRPDASGGCFPCFFELVRQGYEYFETYNRSEMDLKRPPARRFVGHTRFGSIEGIPQILKYTYDGSHSSFPFGDGYAEKTGFYRYQLIDRNKLSRDGGCFKMSTL